MKNALTVQVSNNFFFLSSHLCKIPEKELSLIIILLFYQNTGRFAIGVMLKGLVASQEQENGITVVKID